MSDGVRRRRGSKAQYTLYPPGKRHRNRFWVLVTRRPPRREVSTGKATKRLAKAWADRWLIDPAAAESAKEAADETKAKSQAAPPDAISALAKRQAARLAAHSSRYAKAAGRLRDIGDVEGMRRFLDLAVSDLELAQLWTKIARAKPASAPGAAAGRRRG